jgi:hypothetical protein
MEICESPRVIQTSALRKEVTDFARSAETILLSAILLEPDLNEEECHLIAKYVKMLSGAKHTWSKSLPIKYA